MPVGILRAAGYVPRRRLDRRAIADVFGSGGGKGTRAVASFDEDTTTMGFEAARLALRSSPASPTALWFATTDPAYLDKTNACAIHAALRLAPDVLAMDAGGAVRSGIGAVLSALRCTGPTLVVAADRRGGLPTSTDESAGGDGAAALLIGDAPTDRLLAEHLGSASITREFLDRWRTPGEKRSKQWEERFGETAYTALGQQAWDAALKDAGLSAGDIDHVVVTGPHSRATAALARKLGTNADALVDDLSSSVGNTGTAHALLLLTATLETAAADATVAVVSLADGADVLLLRATGTGAGRGPCSVATQIAHTLDVPYARYLTWRGMVTPEPPRRPEPARVSASAAGRNEAWKFALDDAEHGPLADEIGTIATSTVDRLAWSPSPPVIFAVVDFDNGARLAVELTDVDADAVSIGDRVEMTFRRFSTADGIHNYFWKARPLGEGA
jgi:3-hydroxy-3-methylglutaryl CoA synthase